MRLIKGKTYYTKSWYPSWHGMIDRCENPNASNYPLYGGRGIKVCEEWHNIERFEEWVETSNWEDGLTLDRINVDGDYCPENCRWATKKEQANNRRDTVRVTFLGEEHTLSEWAEILGVNPSTLRNRYYRKTKRGRTNGSLN